MNKLFYERSFAAMQSKGIKAPTGGKNSCKGLIFRAHCVEFYSEKDAKNGNGCVFTNVFLQNAKRLTMRKRLSCPGCGSCLAIKEEMRQAGGNIRIEGFDQIKDGGYYQIVMNEDGFIVVPYERG